MNYSRRVFLLFIMFICGVVLLTGCETLRKKFTRKRNPKDNQEQVIIVPRDYSAHPFPNDVLYKQYFIYWKSWNQELVTSLNDGLSQKKIVDCAQQALINLNKMKTYLNEKRSKEFQVYIKQTEDLKSEIAVSQNMLPSQATLLRYRAERILSCVNRMFDPRKMKDSLI